MSHTGYASLNNTIIIKIILHTYLIIKIMRFDFDTYKEITNTLTRNKSRSFLTGFGVFWGIFMLIFLIGGGRGLQESLQKNFEGFAQNSSMIWMQSTTKPYKGMKKGRYCSMTLKDAEHLRQQIPQLDQISPVVYAGYKNASIGEKNLYASTAGVTANYKEIDAPKLKYGRYISERDIRETRKVCILGKRVYKTLFPEGGNPCGQFVRIDSAYYRIIGVDIKEAGGINLNGNAEDCITMPHTTLRTIYNRGNTVDMMAVTGKKDVIMNKLADKMRTIIAREHIIDPKDETAIMILNTEAIFTMQENLFKSVNFMIWLVGLGTLLAGAIGVSNIMMVTVKERTTEIGIRRAIGARPSMILSQIIMESILLTAVAGFGGIMFGIGLLQLFEMGSMEDGIVTIHYQVNFWIAILATAILCILGGLTGLAPAWRAMKIKPVDAMRDE